MGSMRSNLALLSLLFCIALQAQSIKVDNVRSIVTIEEQPTSNLLNKYNSYETVVFVSKQYIVKFDKDQVIIINPVNNNRLQVIVCKPKERFLNWEAYKYQNQ
jgi:hypothetical protein